MDDRVRMQESRKLIDAARDFRYLLDRGYPRKASLELVGNRYQLRREARELLHRGVFPRTDAGRRRRHLVPLSSVAGKRLAIDGYNVIITIEAALTDRLLVLADDGFLRDISGISASFRKTSTTVEAIDLVLYALSKYKPTFILFLFDSPISRSGELAQYTRTRLDEYGLKGDALAVRVPEHILTRFPGIVATSDTAIIDVRRKVVDLAGSILKKMIQPSRILRLK